MDLWRLGKDCNYMEKVRDEMIKMSRDCDYYLRACRTSSGSCREWY